MFRKIAYFIGFLLSKIANIRKNIHRSSWSQANGTYYEDLKKWKSKK
jgi:hypothetical protein